MQRQRKLPHGPVCSLSSRKSSAALLLTLKSPTSSRCRAFFTRDQIGVGSITGKLGLLASLIVVQFIPDACH